MSRFVHLDKFSLNFSSWPFAFRVNLILVPSWFIITSLVFLISILPNLYFVVSFKLKVILHVAENGSKYRDVAPLTH